MISSLPLGFKSSPVGSNKPRHYRYIEMHSFFFKREDHLAVCVGISDVIAREMQCIVEVECAVLIIVFEGIVGALW